MRRQALIPFVLLSLACLLGPGCRGGGKTVATGNNTKISMDEYQQQVAAPQSMRRGMPLDDAARRQVLEQMVKQELLVQEAANLGLDKKPEVQEKIAASRKEYHEQLETKIEQAKSQLKHMDKDIRNNIMIEELLKTKGG